MTPQDIERIRSVHGGPRSNAEDAMLDDLIAFIEFGIRNGLSFMSIISTLGHDVNGIARYGFDLNAATQDAFIPKTCGYSKVTAECVGETPDMESE